MSPGRRRSPFLLLGGLLAVYLAVPLVAFAFRLGRSHERGFQAPGLWPALRTSVESATIATAIGAVLGIPLAFWLARSRGRFPRLIGTLVQIPIALPPVMAGILLVYMVGPYTTLGRWFEGRLTQSVAGVVLAQAFVSAPFLVVAARASFSAVDLSLDDVAATLGHGQLSRFFRVDVPTAADGLRAGLLLMWLRAIGEYGANVVLAYHPFTLPVYTYVQFSGAGIPDTQAPTVLVLAVAALAVVLANLRLPARPVRLPEPVGRGPWAPTGDSVPTPVAFAIDTNAGDFHLRIEHGAASHRLAILGPSGSGKSLTLKAIAGLLGPSAGRVSFGDDDVSAEPAEHRRVGYVPQGQTLFPRMRLWEQLRFAAGSDRDKATAWLDALGLRDLAGRQPQQMSGGQRQRAALGVALASNPRILLLDEPFSALDAPVRDRLRRQLRHLQLQAGLSTVLVTHDPDEAALLADEVVVISDGRVLQSGPLGEVYRHPASPEVAELLGVANIVTVDGGKLVGVRPEHVLVTPGGDATVIDVADLGPETELTVLLAGGERVVARTAASGAPRLGDACTVTFDSEQATWWPAGELAPEPAARKGLPRKGPGTRCAPLSSAGWRTR